MLRKTLIFIGILGGAYALHAQATPTASRVGDLKIGGGFTNLASDSTPSRFNGGAAYADYDFTPHFGVTAEFHFASDSAGTGQYEKTYEVGGRYFRTYGRLIPYAKVLYGRGVYNFTVPVQTTPGGPITYPQIANLAYNLVGIGGGADYKVLPFLYVRGDWEYQRWFDYTGSSLSPNLITVGAAYHFR